MNETAYKMLHPTKTIEEAMPKIKEAFVAFYGEENRGYIEEKFNNLVIVGYGLPDKLNTIIGDIKKSKTRELLQKFFEEAQIYENREQVEKLLFSNNCSFDYINILPIQKYISYLKIEKDAFNYDFQKKGALDFLKSINPSVTLANMDELIQNGTFSDIDSLIPHYGNMIKAYESGIQELNEYEEEIKYNDKLKRDLNQKYWLQLFNEFSYLFPEKEIQDIKESLERYGTISTYNNKVIESYISSSMISTPLIESFSEECDEILLTGKGYRKESVIRDRIKFFNNMGVNLGEDYELYRTNVECKKLIPSQELIQKIVSRKKELEAIGLNEYYKSTKEYNAHRSRIDSYQLLQKDDGFNANAYFNHSTFVSPNIVYKDGNINVLPVMCIYMNIPEYLDVTVIHELNHVFELNLTSIGENNCEYNCGWDIVSENFQDDVEEVEDLDDRNEKRQYELFNEIINEIIAQDITGIMHNNGSYIFNTKENAKIKYGTSYEHTFFLVRDFYQMYKKEILETRRTRNMEPLFEKIGKENFDALNNLFHEYYENFSGMKIYSVIENLNNKRETELTKIFQKICLDRDNILRLMQSYNLENDIGNQK